MDGAPGSFGLELGIAPSSGTGSDIFDKAYDFEFGGVSVGGGQSWVSSLARDITVGLIVAVAAKYAWSKIK